MSNIDKQALRSTSERDWFEDWFKREFHPDKTGPYIKDQLFFAVRAARAPLLDELEAAEKRIAELEAREVLLPQRYSMLHRVDFDEPYHTEMVYKQHQVLEALHDAGVNVAAAGKGEAS
ncbi:ead/Ea22-like family protein [Salmonella enterica subsp. enterica]|uniref:Ead/Ea22-like family protein n=1 Tax=Salmonella enterica TaxID=28901 RepID=A0A744Z692_SALER|nr:ead/Ea22-like family protein [Salmonella enterica subsp. enterica serovar Minnesota]EAS4951805.1 ead/Ea22-like family protein [Salmonella enterica subsp. enterica serovar Ruiru]EBF9824625.1 ead/Ea22-like family protein [Salmonella enterica subsp. enterica serovar Heidelberg]EEM0330779.1 ead/Ea22-like family protein [Salmonella enterica]EAB8443829.1 ead/Ea22-like family protein [Salmonella enterica subsp. enterica serovar Minnesota]